MRVLRQVHRYHHGSQFRLLPGGLSTGRFTATIKVVILLSSSSQAPLLVGLVLWTFGWAHFWSFLPILDLTGPIFICFLSPHGASHFPLGKCGILLANLLFTLHFLSDFKLVLSFTALRLFDLHYFWTKSRICYPLSMSCYLYSYSYSYMGIKDFLFRQILMYKFQSKFLSLIPRQQVE